MFTGIIQQTGVFIDLDDHESQDGISRLTIAAPGIASQLNLGDSLAVSGVCLTAVELDPEYFYADLATETLERTALGSLEVGSAVNLELPTPAGAPLGGHVVQGHVDGTGTLVSLNPVSESSDPSSTESDWWLTVRIPENLREFMVEKGSIAIEGISLTIARSTIPSGGDTISVAILPLTYERTNLSSLNHGAKLNIEADIMLKYAALKSSLSSAAAPSGEATTPLTEAWLVENGY